MLFHYYICINYKYDFFSFKLKVRVATLVTATVTIDGEGSEVSGFLPFTLEAADFHRIWSKKN